MAPQLVLNNIARFHEKLAREKDESKRQTLRALLAESEQELREVTLIFAQSGNNETRQVKRRAVLYAGRYF
jgi:hypothetical protein